MDMQYKAILANKTIYKEIPLPANATTVSVGTAPGVDVRLSKNLFFLRQVNNSICGLHPDEGLPYEE